MKRTSHIIGYILIALFGLSILFLIYNVTSLYQYGIPLAFIVGNMFGILIDAIFILFILNNMKVIKLDVMKYGPYIVLAVSLVYLAFSFVFTGHLTYGLIGLFSKVLLLLTYVLIQKKKNVGIAIGVFGILYVLAQYLVFDGVFAYTFIYMIANIFLFMLSDILIFAYLILSEVEEHRDIPQETYYNREDIDSMTGSGHHYEEVELPLAIILSFVTFGIYYIVWMYRIGDRINRESRNNKDTGIEILLCYIIPFYRWFWLYNKEKDLMIMYGNRKQDNSMLYLLLQIFGFEIIAIILIQNDLNKLNSGEIVEKAKKSYQRPQKDEFSFEEDEYEKLKKLKDLFDNGFIDEEEYKDKKREILGRI